MVLRRAKFIFDTQIANYIRDGTISPSEWRAVRGAVSKRGRYQISALTLFETIDAIAGGDDAHFQENKRLLEILFEPQRPKCLPLIGDFIRSEVFALLPRKPEFQSRRLRLWIEVILSRKSKAELVDPSPGSDRGLAKYGFDLNLHADQLREGRGEHVKTLEELREGTLSHTTPERWANARLKSMGIDVTPENAATILDALDAGRRYDEFLFHEAKTHAYNFAKHDSDWIDVQQLFYLADPLICFVSCDGDMKHRTKGSPQADRILTFDDLKAKLRAMKS